MKDYTPLSALPAKPLKVQRRGVLDLARYPRALVGPGTGLTAVPLEKSASASSLEAVRDSEVPEPPVSVTYVGARREGLRRARPEVDGSRSFVVFDGAVGWVEARRANE